MKDSMLIKTLISGEECCVTVSNGNVVADHFEVRMICLTNKDLFSSIPEQGVEEIMFFGNWAGSGTGTGAVSGLSEKFFFVDRVEVDGTVITDPAKIESLIPDIDEFVVLPTLFTFSKRGTHPATVSAHINEMLQEAKLLDVFLYTTFGIEGPGAGLFVMPANPTSFEQFAQTAYTLEI